MNNEFNLREDLIYLNHAGNSPWPARTVEAVQNFAAEAGQQGSINYMEWARVEQRVHERLARLLNAASADDIAITRNTSDGLSMVAHGLDWKVGDTVLFCSEEFPSNRFPWQSLASKGVQTRQISCFDKQDPEAALIAEMDKDIRLLTVSSVQFGNGLRLDLKRLGQACKEHNILFCIDAIQSLGALPFDVQDIQADFVAFGGHKWLFSPEGVGGLYVNPTLRESLSLHAFGWHMAEPFGDFDNPKWSPASSARRFEAGSPNTLGIHALNASLSLLEELGMEQVSKALLGNVRYLITGLQKIPNIEILTPLDDHRHAGILVFKPINKDIPALHQYLVANNVVCVPRGGGIRLSPHFYTPKERLDTVLGLIADAP